MIDYLSGGLPSSDPFDFEFDGGDVPNDLSNNLAGDVYYFDGALLERTRSVSSFFDGTGAVLPVDPLTDPFYNPLDCFWESKPRFNYVKNPGFEVTTGWTGTGITLTCEVPGAYASLYGTLSGKATYSSSGSMAITVDLPFTAVGGEDLVVSAYVRGAYTDYTIGTNIAGVAPTSTTFSVADADKNQWIRIHDIRQLQAGETSFVLTISVDNPGGSSTYFHIDGAQAELGRVPTKYMSPLDTNAVATIANPGNPAVSMYGTREQSTGSGKSGYISRYYTKYTRLSGSLPLVMPNGSSWAIRAGINTKELSDLDGSMVSASSFEKDFGTWAANYSTLSRVIYGGLLSGDKISQGTSYGLITTTRDGTGDFDFGVTTDKIYIQPGLGYYASIAIRPANAVSADSYTLKVEFYDEADVLIGASTQTSTVDVTVLTRWGYMAVVCPGVDTVDAYYAKLSVTCDPVAWDAEQAFHLDRVVFRN